MKVNAAQPPIGLADGRRFRAKRGLSYRAGAERHSERVGPVLLGSIEERQQLHDATDIGILRAERPFVEPQQTLGHGPRLAEALRGEQRVELRLQTRLVAGARCAAWHR